MPPFPIERLREASGLGLQQDTHVSLLISLEQPQAGQTHSLECKASKLSMLERGEVDAGCEDPKGDVGPTDKARPIIFGDFDFDMFL